LQATVVRRQWLTADPCARPGRRVQNGGFHDRAAKGQVRRPFLSKLASAESLDNAFPTRHSLHALLIATMVALVLSVSKRRQAHELCNFPTRRRRSNVNLPVTEVTRLFV